MKKIIYLSGVLTILLFILYMAGAIDLTLRTADTVLSEGNKLMEAGMYQQALEKYKKGLEEDPDDPELNYNAGQALYKLGEYASAAEYYEKSSLSTPDRYINLGNCYLKQNYCNRAAECYKQGILEFPQDVPLKYNYEYALEQIRKMEQEADKDEEKDEEDEQNSGEDEQGDNKDKQSGGDSDQDDGENKQTDGESEQGEGEDEKDSGEDEQSSSGDDQDDGEDKQNGNESEPDDGGQDSGNSIQSSGTVPDDPDDAAQQRQARSVIENALEALERQEAESLKNNRGKDHSYEEGQYEW